MVDQEKKMKKTGTLQSKLVAELGLQNINQAPEISKVVFNVGVKKSDQDNKALDYIVKGLRSISGQQPVKTVAKKSIAGFKLREGTAIGAKVTLRRSAKDSFIEKLTRIVIPSIRNFRGLKAKFDKSGNYNLGIKDWMIFPEIGYDDFPVSKGLNITFHIKNGDDKKKSFLLLKELGFPFAV